MAKKPLDPDEIRHYAPTYERAACGGAGGWWVKTPRHVTCRECQASPQYRECIHMISGRRSYSRCGLGPIPASNLSDNPKRVSCGRCIPRAVRKPGKGTTVHLIRDSQDPLAPEKAVCNLPYAAIFTTDLRKVTCGICKKRWSPTCRYCGGNKESRSATCRRAECKQAHQAELDKIAHGGYRDVPTWPNE